MKVRTNVKAGGNMNQHNETLVRAAAPAKGLKVKTNLKAGFNPQPEPPRSRFWG